ncbi:uncharacterized protein LOC143049871 [Mytilus galloprovincialis]|uniref:uncharacterized protein LOC143049871 n=1 Tax=Mytilus galloprovincialis TaxID=29158 RepID=UPI003F7B3D0A
MEEFYPKDIDTFLERHIIDVDDHESICEAGNGPKKMAEFFYDTISEIKFIEKGSFDCLIHCLETNESHKKIRQKLAKALMSSHKPEQAFNRTTITATATDGDIYTDNTRILTEGELVLKFDDEETETKEILEIETLRVGKSSEYQYREIDGLKLTVTDAKKSSVLVDLKSTGGNVKYIVEKGIANGDLTSFIRKLLDNENIKMHMSPKTKYKVSVIIRSKNEQLKESSGTVAMKKTRDIPKMRIIQANRVLLEEEYDPLPLVNAFCDRNVRQYKSVGSLSAEKAAYVKQQFMGIKAIEDRRKRVQQFLNIAEDNIEADQLWNFIKDTANAFVVKKMEEARLSRSLEAHGVRLSARCPGNGLVFKGTYEFWITEKDVKSPLQSLIVEERKKKDQENRYSEDGIKRRKQRKERKLNEDVEFWKTVRNDTLPNLRKLKEELINANEKIRTAKLTGSVSIVTLIGGALLSVFTGGASWAGALATVAITGGVAGVTVLLIETYVEKGVLKRSQEGIDNDKEATINLLRRVRAYSGTESIPFADQLYHIQLESIDNLARDPIGIFLNRLIDVQSASLINAIARITEIIEKLEMELQEVEKVQELHSWLV